MGPHAVAWRRAGHLIQWGHVRLSEAPFAQRPVSSAAAARLESARRRVRPTTARASR
jgi:hypothetical protein